MRWLRFQFRTALRRHRQRIRDWIEANPRRVRLLERVGALNIDEGTLARGVAVGLFIGMTPTVGIQTLLMLAGAFAFRANFLAAFAVSNVSNPLTVAPLYYGWNRLGRFVVEKLPIEPAVIDAIIDDPAEEVAFETLAMFAGSLITAVPTAAFGYYAFLWLWRKLELRLPARAADQARGAQRHRPD